MKYSFVRVNFTKRNQEIHKVGFRTGSRELKEHDGSGFATTPNKLGIQRNFKYTSLTVISVIKLIPFLNFEKTTVDTNIIDYYRITWTDTG